MEPLELLREISSGKTLTADETATAVAGMLSGEWGDVETAALLATLAARGETADELVGAATELRRRAAAVDLGDLRTLDTCGTGGDRRGTFNISTATALVVAACGVPVAKHGNRAASSHSGSADVLAELGVKVQNEPAATVRCLREVGIAFFFAPQWHQAVGKVGPVRKRLGFRTLFNLVGPLCNPARPAFQVLGVGRRRGDKLPATMAEALKRLGVERGLVVSATDGLDEVTLDGLTEAYEVAAEGPVKRRLLAPQDFGLAAASANEWTVGSTSESAARIREVLGGAAGACRDVVLANAAAALVVAGLAADWKTGVA
ncbi:MAG TPA: anthranilate phosphoribosyltransferase, partial [Planctomycetia bacterium]|nr:anthranilate phosphoribosyltransferase [Planctomycetia bacterium]